MAETAPSIIQDADTLVDAIVERVGPRVVVAAPIGVGKPNHVLNALYRRAVSDPELSLRIVTGLSVAKPRPKEDLERRFLEPFLERVFGDYPDLDYVGPYQADRLPPNVEVLEFYMRPGAFLGNDHAQRHYINSNYTHMARDVMIQGVNVYAQTVARRTIGEETRYSLSSNADCLELFAQFPPL